MASPQRGSRAVSPAPSDRSIETRMQTPMAKRILVNPVLLVAFILVSGCSSGPEAPPAEQVKREPGTASSDVLRFTLEENGQSLELRNGVPEGFDVAVSVAGTCSRNEAGFAKVVQTEGDVDVAVDPDGEGHPTDTFALTARNECRVTIRLAAPERNYAWVRESDCATACPLSNKPMTRR